VSKSHRIALYVSGVVAMGVAMTVCVPTVQVMLSLLRGSMPRP
jgi:hypothetical protein